MITGYARLSTKAKKLLEDGAVDTPEKLVRYALSRKSEEKEIAFVIGRERYIVRSKSKKNRQKQVA